VPLQAPLVQLLYVPQLVPDVGVISLPPLQTLLVPTLAVGWATRLLHVPPPLQRYASLCLTQVLEHALYPEVLQYAVLVVPHEESSVYPLAALTPWL